MPIPVDNSLPTLQLLLGPSPSGSINLGCLFDSCAAISSGYKLFHWYLMSKFPEIIHSYEEHDDPARPFHPIKLAGTIKDPNQGDKDVLGELSAIV